MLLCAWTLLTGCARTRLLKTLQCMQRHTGQGLEQALPEKGPSAHSKPSALSCASEVTLYNARVPELVATNVF